MEYGIATTSVVPMRAEPDERSEMVSQLLWGETFRAEETAGRWLRIRANADRHVGWVNPLMVQQLGDSLWEREAALPYCLCASAICFAADEKTGQHVFIPQGSILYCYNEVAQTFALLDHTYKLKPAPDKLPDGKRAAVLEAAMRMLNAPYLWGGRTALGLDCSGLTQLAYRLGANVTLPRDAAVQAEKGEAVGFVESAQPADLAFFCNDEGKVVHVGLLLGDRQIIHASGCVHVDTIDNEGIYSKPLKRYTHKLKMVKSIL
jgi:hypothetical protein